MSTNFTQFRFKRLTSSLWSDDVMIKGSQTKSLSLSLSFFFLVTIILALFVLFLILAFQWNYFMVFKNLYCYRMFYSDTMFWGIICIYFPMLLYFENYKDTNHVWLSNKIQTWCFISKNIMLLFLKDKLN